MNAGIVRVQGQDLWVSVKPGAKDVRRSLVQRHRRRCRAGRAFHARDGRRRDRRLRHPRRGGSPLPRLPYRPRLWRAGPPVSCASSATTGSMSRASPGAAAWPSNSRMDIPEFAGGSSWPRRAGVIMVPGKLSVLWKMATPRRFVDPDYLRSIAAEIYGENCARIQASFMRTRKT